MNTEHLFSASPLVAALTGDHAVLAAILAVESSWAAVLGRLPHRARRVTVRETLGCTLEELQELVPVPLEPRP